MTNATFFNWTDEAFTGYWNGKGKTFAPGERRLMPSFLAEHFAKHLTNRELIKANKVTSTSPKFPGQVPEFMDLFRKAYIAEAVSEQDEIDAIIASAEITSEPSMNITPVQPRAMTENSPAAAMQDEAEDAVHEAPSFAPAGPSMIVAGPDADEDEYDLIGQQQAAPNA